jgi:hypothetical protein
VKQESALSAFSNKILVNSSKQVSSLAINMYLVRIIPNYLLSSASNIGCTSKVVHDGRLSVVMLKHKRVVKYVLGENNSELFTLSLSKSNVNSSQCKTKNNYRFHFIVVNI